MKTSFVLYLKLTCLAACLTGCSPSDPPPESKTEVRRSESLSSPLLQLPSGTNALEKSEGWLSKYALTVQRGANSYQLSGMAMDMGETPPDLAAVLKFDDELLLLGEYQDRWTSKKYLGILHKGETAYKGDYQVTLVAPPSDAYYTGFVLRKNQSPLKEIGIVVSDTKSQNNEGSYPGVSVRLEGRNPEIGPEILWKDFAPAEMTTLEAEHVVLLAPKDISPPTTKVKIVWLQIGKNGTLQIP